MQYGRSSTMPSVETILALNICQLYTSGAILSPSCLGAMHAHQSRHDYETFHSLKLFSLPDALRRHLTHRCAKLLAAWLFAELDLTIFWAAAQESAAFTDAQMAHSLHAASIPFEEESDKLESLSLMLEQNQISETILYSDRSSWEC